MLVDWNAGIRSVVGEALLPRYHELEPQVQAEDPSRSYRDVLHEVSAQLSLDDPDELARSLPAWPVFPEARESLDDAHRRGWKLAILSNTDRDFIEASMASIGVPFEFAIVASEIGSYKPARGHWRAFEKRVARLPDVHVAASLYHDVGPANELDLKSVWVDRLGERPDPQPTREIPDLSTLPGVLD